jgi:NCS1 family nucleobase:cation symporter-1
MGKASTFMRKLETPHPEGLSNAQLFLTNEDLLPVRKEHKTWNHWNFVSPASMSPIEKFVR